MARTRKRETGPESKMGLVIIDDPNLMNAVEQQLDHLTFHRVSSFDSALDGLLSHPYDFVVLDMAHAEGFHILQHAAYKGIPAFVFLSHDPLPKSLKIGTELGPIFLLPKENPARLRSLVKDRLSNRKSSVLIGGKLDLTEKQIADYFRHCCMAIDGLWFMKVEESAGFETALETDVQVWQVFPKIQARKLRELTGLGTGAEALYECLTYRLFLDGFRFTAIKDTDRKGFTVSITDCPFLARMDQAQRRHIARAVGPRICDAEFSSWAIEFTSSMEFDLQTTMCTGQDRCILRFELKKQEAFHSGR